MGPNDRAGAVNKVLKQQLGKDNNIQIQAEFSEISDYTGSKCQDRNAGKFFDNERLQGVQTEENSPMLPKQLGDMFSPEATASMLGEHSIEMFGETYTLHICTSDELGNDG